MSVKIKKEERTKYCTFKCTPSEQRKIMRLAKKYKYRNISAYLRDCALNSDKKKD